MNQTDHLTLIKTLAIDCTNYISHTLSYDSISDDDTDYLPAASAILDHCLAAICDDDPNTAAADLMNRLLTASYDNDDELATDAHTCDFRSPALDLLPYRS